MSKFTVIAKSIAFKTIIFLEIIKQYFFVRRLIGPMLKKCNIDDQGIKVTDGIYQMAVFVEVFFGYNYCKLAGIKIDSELRKKLTLLSALVSPYDTLTDTDVTAPERLDMMLNEPDKITPRNKTEKAAIELFREFLKTNPSRTSLKYIYKLHSVQKQTILQKKRTIPRKKLERICAEKGAYTAIATVSLCKDNISKQETDAIFSVGAWTQMADDGADISKDTGTGIYTLANHPIYKKQFNSTYIKYKDACFSKIMALPYPKKRKEDFLFMYSMLLALVESKWMLRRKESLLNALKHYLNSLYDIPSRIKTS